MDPIKILMGRHDQFEHNWLRFTMCALLLLGMSCRLVSSGSVYSILMIFILLALTLLPILLPMNVLGGRNEAGGVKGLDRLSFSNVALSHADRYWAHLLTAIFVAVSVYLVLQGELQSYSRFQQATEASQFKGSSILLVSTSEKPLSFEIIQNHFRSVSAR